MNNDELLKELEELKSTIAQFQESIKRFENELNKPDTLKLKVGDVCEVTGDKGNRNHGVAIGEIIRIEETGRCTGSVGCKDRGGYLWYVSPIDLKKLF